MPKHTLYPRTKGFIATVRQLRDSQEVKAVYDVTIAYANGSKFLVTPTFWQSLSCSGFGRSDWKFHAHVDRYPIDTLPWNDADLATWLEKRWIEKGERLEDLRDESARGVEWSNDLVAD